MHYLYKITNNLNGKIYIGQTNNPKLRWQQHKSDARGKHKQYIHRAMAKYGIDNFAFEIIAMSKTIEDINQTETIVIAQYQSKNCHYGYNIALGGKHGMLGFHHSDETKKKMSDAKKGYVPSEETRQRMRIARSKMIITTEWAANMSKSHKGKKMSEEAKQNMSKAQKLLNRDLTELTKKAAEINRGKKRSPETIQKMIANHKGSLGMKHTDEAKKKIGNAAKNRKKGPMSEETKLKISQKKKGNSPSPNKGKTWKIVEDKRIYFTI